MLFYSDYPTDRKVIELFRVIKRGEERNKTRLAQLFHTSTKNIENWVNKLIDVWQVEIEYNRSKGEYMIYNDGSLQTLRISNPLTADDINLILFTLVQSKSFMPMKMHIIQNILLQMLPEEERKNLKSVLSAENQSGFNDDFIRSYIQNIREAITEKKKVSFQYRSQNTEGMQEKIVIPYSFAWELGKYYLIGKPDEKNVLRHYRLDRMSNVRKLNEVGIRSSDFNIEQYLKRTWYMYSGEPTKVRVKFHKDAYKVVTERNMQDGYMVENAETEDYFIYEFIANGVDGVLIWLLGFGERVEILKPESLRLRAKEIAQNMAKVYSE